MKKKVRFVFPVLAGLLLGPLVATVPSAIAQQATKEQTAETKSVSGQIAAVSKTSFTLTVGSAISNSGEQSSAKSMTFTIDKNTTVNGTLRVGSNADVTYREDNGNYIAVGVRVS